MLSGLPTLIDIVAGAGASNPRNFTNVNNTVFFGRMTTSTEKNFGRATGRSPVR